jgi:tetratricopeptide (TPR) repeat protein
VRSLVKSQIFWVLLAGAIPLVFYLLTLCPTVYSGDGGELGLAATNLEIAHPPGYPLLTNFGHVWTSLLFFLRPILALNLLSALGAAAAAAFLFLALSFLGPVRTIQHKLIFIAVSVAFGLGQTLWSVATNFEVYSLSATMTAVVMALLVKFYYTGARRWFLLGCYLTGLALCNHLSAASVGIMLLLVAWYQRRNLSLTDYLVGLSLAVLPLTFYSYLYLRASHDLVLAWYDPQTLWGLRQHLFAHAYQRYVSTPHMADILPYLVEVWRLLSHEFVLPFAVIALPGVFLQWRRDRGLARMLSSIVLFNCGLNINYLIPDIMPYFLPTIMVTTVWIAESLGFIANRSRVWLQASVASSIVFVIVVAAGNFARSNISDRRGAEEYAEDLFARVPPGGSLFCGSDNSMFPALYLRYVEKYRSDCKVYGLLPTLTRLRADLGLSTTPGYNKSPELLRYAIANQGSRLVFAQEPMQIVNDFRTLVPSLYPSGLVYYVDSASQVAASALRLNWRNPPRLYDQKEAVLYATYDLLCGEELNKAGDPEGQRLWSKAVDIVGEQENFALSNELSGFLVAREELRLARKTLERSMSIAGLRQSQRLRLLASLGSVEFESRNIRRAAEIFDEVIRKEPDNVIARYHLLAIKAQEATASNRTEEAIGTYREMLTMFPEQRGVNLELGRLLLKTGDTSSARAMLDICLRDNYRVDEVRKLLK